MVTAITLCCVFLGGAAAYAVWALAAFRRGVDPWLLLAGGPAVYLAVFAAITAFWFSLAWIYRVRRPPAVELDIAASIRLFIGELLTLAGSGLRMGFGWWLMREPAPAPAPAPVLLLHGVLCNAGVWLGMRGVLRRSGVGPIYTLSYGPPLASIERFADQLKVRIDAILAATGASTVALVGHSMGGLVARAYLRRHGSRRVERLITLGTPHAGSILAWTFPGTSLQQMRPGSAWLASLNAAAPPSAPIVAIWSWHDSMVAPQDSARLAGARNVAVTGVGHNALLRDANVIALVVQALRGPLGAAPGRGADARDLTSEFPG